MDGKFSTELFTTIIDESDTSYWTRQFAASATESGDEQHVCVRTNLFTEEDFLLFKTRTEG